MLKICMSPNFKEEDKIVLRYMIMKFSYLNKQYTLFLHTITLNRQSTTFKIKEIPLREFSVTKISSSFVS